ncbi:NADH:flavin oxidoreductase [Ruminiclostridium cellulolyticum]|uniref:NADH:flavin oxidoreductase/NADH oxidase n=1 Tax=Ruminiclostridium cellulolyticum (strain ATCC 35319 / DSM 5812 / JCM 6584 / H10) TaxID=394503 RepID=B8HZW6_RUMCH|nr:NADH:flavin oxidoreductase [Ruminiclostridium cellulolyticum]ACL75466.1 NADH:flavin oxidoreductase/NADH oxidase [Ruminiclostridium cellulolyticum H10]
MELLHKPLSIGALKLSNRLVMPPMATAKSEDDGKVSQDIIDYYDEKSKGGHIGLVIIEHSYISKEGKASSNQLSIADDSVIENLKNLSDVIHRNGSKAIMQINHAGSATSAEITGSSPVGPSTVPHPRNPNVIPRELSKDEIKDIISSFANAAERVKKAGFDGVEIHSAHGYLLSQFFSPISNKRSDEYGGNVLSRIKIHLQIINAVKKAVGEDFTVFLRLGASDYMEGGITIEDSLIATGEFEKAGVSALDISGGFCGYIKPDAKEQGYFWPLTKAIKEHVSIPVILTGGITDAESAEQLLAGGKADLIGVGRSILKDSGWAAHAMGI